MGTVVHLHSGCLSERTTDQVARETERLEAMWSRFRPDSDVSRMNAAGGQATPVAPETVDLVGLAIDGWRWSGGRFDPTVHDAVVAAGYDRTFLALGPTPRSMPPPDVPGPAEIEVDPPGRVRLPPAVALDLGGIGKGRAADLISEVLAEQEPGLLNLGGDLRVTGAPRVEPWQIGIVDPFDPASTSCTLQLTQGALATSSTRTRHWTTRHGHAHHLIDPLTGAPADSGIASVTVLADSAAWAEIAAKSVLISGLGDGLRMLERQALPALVVTDAGQIVATEPLLAHVHPQDLSRVRRDGHDKIGLAS